MLACTITENRKGRRFTAHAGQKTPVAKHAVLRQSGSEVKLAPLKAVEGGENVV